MTDLAASSFTQLTWGHQCVHQTMHYPNPRPNSGPAAIFIDICTSKWHCKKLTVLICIKQLAKEYINFANRYLTDDVSNIIVYHALYHELSTKGGYGGDDQLPWFLSKPHHDQFQRYCMSYNFTKHVSLFFGCSYLTFEPFNILFTY